MNEHIVNKCLELIACCLLCGAERLMKIERRRDSTRRTSANERERDVSDLYRHMNRARQALEDDLFRLSLLEFASENERQTRLRDKFERLEHMVSEMADNLSRGDSVEGTCGRPAQVRWDCIAKDAKEECLEIMRDVPVAIPVTISLKMHQDIYIHIFMRDDLDDDASEWQRARLRGDVNPEDFVRHRVSKWLN